MLTEHQVDMAAVMAGFDEDTAPAVIERFARAIESAACAPLLERIAALEADLRASEDRRRAEIQARVSTVSELEAKLAQRVPLTDEQRRKIIVSTVGGGEITAIGRAIDMVEALHGISAAPAAPEQQEPDDAAVDAFAAAMKAKLAAARAKGRGGWQECDAGVLSGMLRAHVEKGDPRDVANFCMFLWSLGYGIAQAPNAQQSEPMSRIAKLKLSDLIAKGYRECGVMIEMEHSDGKVTRGAVSNGGMVIWWHPEQMEAAHTREQQAEAQPVAEVIIGDDEFDLGLTDDYAFGKLKLPNGRHMLYPAPPKAVPLTPDQIENGAEIGEFDNLGRWQIFEAGVRFAEAAHGIVAPAEKGG